jgi:hypothetical protein
MSGVLERAANSFRVARFQEAILRGPILDLRSTDVKGAISGYAFASYIDDKKGWRSGEELLASVTATLLIGRDMEKSSPLIGFIDKSYEFLEEAGKQTEFLEAKRAGMQPAQDYSQRRGTITSAILGLRYWSDLLRPKSHAES